MMQRNVLFLCLMIALVGICGCRQQIDEKESSIASTGYPEGEIQREYVYYDDTLYVYSGSCRTSLPENCELAGKVHLVDNINLPEEDFHACRLKVGNEVYVVTDERLLYVKTGEERFERFVPEKEVEEASSIAPTGPPVGEIQREYVYYDNTLYVYSDSCRTSLPENCELVGEVLSVDNINLPQEDFHAARLTVGDEVYAVADEELLYVKTGEERFERFVPEKANEEESSIALTGYPEGEIQRKYVYYDGILYVYSDSSRKLLPENCEFVGLVRTVDNINLPQEDFAAARLMIGDRVYAATDEELLYVKTGEERFECFVPETDENVQDYYSQD